MRNRQEMAAEERTFQILFKEKNYNETGKIIKSMLEYRKHRRDKIKTQWKEEEEIYKDTTCWKLYVGDRRDLCGTYLINMRFLLLN